MQQLSSIMEEVTTYDGTKAYRKNCRFIKGAYYIKNVQCFLIEDRWYRINSGYVVYDHRLREWILSSEDNLEEGIVNISEKGIPELGFFSEGKGVKELPTYLLYDGSVRKVLDARMLNDIPDVREGMNGHYYFANDRRGLPKSFTTKLKPQNKESFYHFPFNYGSEELIPEFSKVFENEFEGAELLSDSYKYLEGYSYGVEFETNIGAIPERHLRKNGLIACRDGSINGFEYATVPLKGSVGIQAIKTSCELLSRFCECSPNESLHVHVSGYPRTIPALAALFRLGKLIEVQIYGMFPYCYADTSSFKRKSYCGPLPSVGNEYTTPEEIFGQLFFWLSNGHSVSKTLPTGPHPMDRSGQHKWEISPRYVWLNMIPLIWGGRGTVEFRCHTPTVNPQKVINWIFICVAILKYARRHTKLLTSSPLSKLAKIKLATIISEIYPKKVSTILCKYIEDRTNYYAGKNDPVGEGEILGESKSREVFNILPFV